MNLAQALKKKNRLAQTITTLQTDIAKENSAPVDDPRKISVEDLMKELESSVKELINLKMVIFVASTPVREHILKLSELKSRINFLHSINTTEGKIQSYGEGPIFYSAVFDKVWVKAEVQKCDAEIDALQNELDKFNYNTEVDC